MKARIFIFTSFLAIPLHTYSREQETSDVAFCDLVNQATSFQDRAVKVAAVAKGLTSYFDLVLENQACPGKYIALVADHEVRETQDYLSMVKRLYPGYPDTFDNTEEAVPVEVTGRFFLKQQDGVEIKFLKAERIEVSK